MPPELIGDSFEPIPQSLSVGAGISIPDGDLVTSAAKAIPSLPIFQKAAAVTLPFCFQARKAAILVRLIDRDADFTDAPESDRSLNL
jgi:hypothetical protein